MKELEAIEKLTDSLTLFPSIGEKTAERMAYALLDMSQEKVDRIISSIKNVKTKIHSCPNCGLLTEDNICSICSDTDRDHSTCIVIESSKDAIAFENTNSYNGTYHVLGGLISPSKNIGPDKLTINKLVERIQKEKIKELIIATSGTLDGETTALYIARILQNLDIKISRIACGIPMGANLDYLDSLTLDRAIKGRTTLK